MGSHRIGHCWSDLAAAAGGRKTRSTEYKYKRHCRAGSENQIICRLVVRPQDVGGFSAFEFGSNDAKTSISMNGSMNVIHTTEPYVHLLATPLYVEGLTMVPMLGQLVVLAAGG